VPSRVWEARVADQHLSWDPWVLQAPTDVQGVKEVAKAKLGLPPALCPAAAPACDQPRVTACQQSRVDSFHALG